MPRKKNRMKLPNGFGSIKYLGAGRRNPYAAYPPVQEWTPKGPIAPPALGYKGTWEDAYELLTTYNLEKQGKIKVNRNVYIDRSPSFSEVYDKFYQEKFFNSPKKFSVATARSSRAAFKNCHLLHDIQIGQIKYDNLQNVINTCPLKYSSLELIVSLMHQIYKYAMKYELVDKDYSKYIYIPKPDDDESGVPFTETELKTLWYNKTDDIVSLILIMCYSGFRLRAYKNLEINLNDRYFKGGVKTAASKNRTVPIHPAIYNLVKDRNNGSGDLIIIKMDSFRQKMYDTLEHLQIERHTPHDCRHTFSALCEKYGVNENDRKRMLGHSFGNDITNAKYGHRTIEELRTEIEKIKIP